MGNSSRPDFNVLEVAGVKKDKQELIMAWELAAARSDNLAFQHLPENSLFLKVIDSGHKPYKFIINIRIYA